MISAQWIPVAAIWMVVLVLGVASCGGTPEGNAGNPPSVADISNYQARVDYVNVGGRPVPCIVAATLDGVSISCDWAKP